jgi:hypothetical protein
MNELSWMLYLADVANSAGATFAVAGFLIFLWASIVTICRLAYITAPSYTAGSKYEAEWKSIADFWHTKTGSLPRLFLSAFLLLVVNVMTPSKETIYAIAASEVGENILTSGTVSKAHKALDKWLDKQLEPEQKP